MGTSALKVLYAVERLGQCCGPGVPKLEWHHHYYGLVMNQLQCTYGEQLHLWNLVLEDTGPAIIGGAWLQIRQVILILFWSKIIMNYFAALAGDITGNNCVFSLN